MSMDDRWLSYLYRAHSEETLRDWAKRLHLFRFVRAVGGHTNDGDTLVVAYHYASEGELHDFFARLGIQLVHYEQRPPEALPGVSYSSDAFSSFPSLIPGTEWFAQPSHREIADQSVFIWCSKAEIKLSIARSYEVTEADVQSAELVEAALRDVLLPRIEPPVGREHCVCPKYYPELFKED